VNDFSWLIEGKLAGMARPDPSDAEELRELGITAVVCLTRRPVFAAPPKGMKLLHLPVVDMSAPTQAQLEEATRFLDEAIEGGGRAVVHCLAGQGRTGTVLAAYLVSKGEEPEEAIHRVRRARPGSIETAEQEHAVHLFAEKRGSVSRKTAGRKGR
jgi:atypical dual specificity phosphatase